MGATVFSINEFVTLDTHVCGECGITFAMPTGFRTGRQKDGKTFYCPNGHGRVFCGESEVDRLRARLADAQREATRIEELRRASVKEAEHNAIEWRKSKTRLRNLRERVKNGVCPCCKRSFVELAQHIATEHPEFDATEAT